MKSPSGRGMRGVGAAGLIAGLCVLAGASGAAAQTDKSAGLSIPNSDSVIGGTGHRSTLAKMFRRITTEFNENKLEDVIKFIEDYTGSTIETYWADSGGEGLNPEQMITLKVKNLPALTVLERVLAKASSDAISGGNTWQMTEYGTIEIGPKAVLNRTKRTEIYDLHDLLMELPRYDEVPQIDLQSLLQQSQQGGGGGGQSPFTNDQTQNQGRDPDLMTQEEKGNEIIRLITTLVEPEEWIDGGGEGGTIRYYNGNILVSAPDYMHRQINGYTYWPSHTSRVVGGQRYVSLNTDNSIGTIDGFTNIPVTAVVGGQLVPSGPGGSKAPSTPGSPGKATTPGGTGKPNGTVKPAATKPAAPAPKPAGTAKEPAKKDAAKPAATPPAPAKKDKK